jgi:hypothetical protein
MIKKTLEDEYPELYDLIFESDDPDIVRQAAEIMLMLPDTTPMDEKILRQWGIPNLCGKVFRVFDFYLVSQGKTYVILYPTEEAPFYRWISATGRRERWAKKSVIWWLRNINEAWLRTASI